MMRKSRLRVMVGSMLLLGAWRAVTSQSARATVGHQTPLTIDSVARALMQQEHVQGLAIAVIDKGRVTHVSAYGSRNVAKKLPLTTHTIMYGASLTKTAVTYLVLQLVDEGRLRLDTPIESLLPKPLPQYEDYTDLAADPHWKLLTLRHVLTHTTGFANFRELEPDRKLRFHAAPGTRYGYSGEGFYILQLVLEEGLHLELGAAMQQRVFDRFRMSHTSMKWRDDFQTNLADGYTLSGGMVPHDERSRPTAAGSMDTDIDDQSRFWAGLVRGDGISAASRRALLESPFPIASAHQFPTLDTTRGGFDRTHGLAAGLGVVTVRDARGAVWWKGGHNDSTGNIVVCVQREQRCVVLLSNDVRAERMYPALVRFVLGPLAIPWSWEYH